MTEEAKLIVETLRYCDESGARCGDCPSGALRCPSQSEMADLIESLSTENEILNAAIGQLGAIECHRDMLEHELEQVTRERDAAIEDLREADRIDCEHCIAYKLYDDDMCIDADYTCADCLKECPCKTCRNNSNWQWRGVEVEG